MSYPMGTPVRESRATSTNTSIRVDGEVLADAKELLRIRRYSFSHFIDMSMKAIINDPNMLDKIIEKGDL